MMIRDLKNANWSLLVPISWGLICILQSAPPSLQASFPTSLLTPFPAHTQLSNKEKLVLNLDTAWVTGRMHCGPLSTELLCLHLT